MTSFVLATANEHKATEMRSLLGRLGFEVVERPEDVPEVEETEDSLEGNALLKARALVEVTGCAAIADDTGLFVDSLDGAPGVLSARYSSERATYESNVAKLLHEMKEVPDSKRSASFRTVICVAFPDGSSTMVEGLLRGTITRSPRGENGFGYDPVFAVEHDGPTLAEMTAEEKNSMSHRAIALLALAQSLGAR
ncbi:MAG: RdgB/HAM1 family non-canonical purine NTP pyrophosphatase [Acidimicrobiaceae bacterium]|nr:RdgB/HAM1 family non-canonical purine NTP pyrophosphatase [Acidimicrobiaceae bacterium]